MLNTAVTLFDFYSVKRALAEDSTRTGLIRRAQFHLLNFLGLCKACDCSGTTLCTCLNCGELWDKFLQDTGRRVPDKAQLPAALDAWRVWGQHADLSLQQQELCLGLERSVHGSDRATTGSATLA